MQKSKVYFVGLRARGPKESKLSKVTDLVEALAFAKKIEKDDLVAVKVHFGERGNDTFISPMFVRAAVDKIHAAGGKPFVTDTNTLYGGSRHNSVDHITTAMEHGFAFATVNAPVIIADGLCGAFAKDVPVKGKHFKDVKIAGAIAEADAMLVFSHFKAHEMAGFGGAVKNLAMGCSPNQGKKEQHGSVFTVEAPLCISCAACIKACPEKAISFKEKKAYIDAHLCIGCGQCITLCPTKAIEINWETELAPFVEKMVEYAAGAVKGKESKVAYINFLINITPDCDCVSWSDTPIVSDIGMLASYDPVALDKACFDLVNNEEGLANSALKSGHARGEDKFKGTWSYTKGEKLFAYAEEMGLGSTNYELIEL